MKATAKQIFNHIKMLTPQVSEISSMGSYISESAKMIANAMHREVIPAVAENSLAYKILRSRSASYTEKQLWVIAFELEKNENYATQLGEELARIEAKENFRIAESKAKLAANKEASADVLAPIKAAKKLGEFGKWLNDAKNPFRKQHFSKKYTQEAVNQFLQTI